jgi:7-cyano-7-deazaguanine synthase
MPRTQNEPHPQPLSRWERGANGRRSLPHRGRGDRKAVGEVAVLASGGLDSCALVGDLARNRSVIPIYIRQGLAWEAVELYWLKRFLAAVKSPRIKPLHVFDLPMGDLYGDHWSTGKGKVPGSHSNDREVYLPGRNLILMVKAATFCALHKILAIAVGSLGHNPFPDASPRFFKHWSRTLKMGLKSSLSIEAPYRSLSKVQVIKRAAGLPLHLSFSCLAPVGKKHCGRCNKCAERRKAFKNAGVEDRTTYA